MTQDPIEPTDSPLWISNLVVVRKKSGAIPLYVDRIAVKKAVIPGKYLLPTVDELASHFHDSMVFSTLDLNQGYLQIPLTEQSRNAAAFVSYDGIYRFKRMPSSLSSAPSAIQKIMRSIVMGLKGVSVYTDDIVVHSLYSGGTRRTTGYRFRSVAQAEGDAQ